MSSLQTSDAVSALSPRSNNSQMNAYYGRLQPLPAVQIRHHCSGSSAAVRHRNTDLSFSN